MELTDSGGVKAKAMRTVKIWYTGCTRKNEMAAPEDQAPITPAPAAGPRESTKIIV